MIEIFFDVETKNLFSDIDTRNPGDLGVSVVSVYTRELDNNKKEIQGDMRRFWEHEFTSMWKIFREADRIIGFNSLKFDVPALQPYALFDLAELSHFDIMEKIRKSLGRRLSLDNLARRTLKETKIDTGINAVWYWRSADKESLIKLKTYCEMDVQITCRLYDFGMKNKYLKFTDKWNNPRRVAIDFSYPANTTHSSRQGSLF
ncbi:MAG: ribonuclease H-like domain-containing protein [Actinomycetia bacterium]|nr:ribonuclease H-like domain-containing protein [Actinomycetes bacterium]